jgi:hypothetical protein
MARKAKDAEGRKSISAEELHRVLKEAIKHKKAAAEENGSHGNVIAKAVERFGLERKSLTWTRQLTEMDDGKRQGIIRQAFDLWNKMEFFDQIDAFDDLIPLMEEIVAEAKKRQAAKPKPAADGKPKGSAPPTEGAPRDGAPLQ